MCSPTVVLGMQAAAGASQTVGSFYAAQSQRNQLGMQADVADIQARGALAAGEREQQRSRMATAQLKSRQVATMAANGVALDSGTPNAVLTGTDLLGEIDAQTIEQNAIMQAWGYRTEARMDRARADAVNPTLAAATTLVGAASQVSESWYRMKKADPSGAGVGAAGGGMKPPAGAAAWWKS